MNRRFFHRVDVHANGELLWATRSRLRKVKTHRKYITTENVSVSGAKIILNGDFRFPVGSRAQLKLGLEYCEVEVLEVLKSKGGLTMLRLTFITPSSKFVTIVEQWMPISTGERDDFVHAWT
jgi:hypothetical protein